MTATSSPTGRRKRTHPLGTAHPEFPPPRPADEAVIEEWGWELDGRRSDNTKYQYLLAARLLARWLAHHELPHLREVTRGHMLRYFSWMAKTARQRNGNPYSGSYQHNQWRNLKVFFRWLEKYKGAEYAMFDIEEPKVDEKLTELLTADQAEAFLTIGSRSRHFEDARDHAIIRLFMFTGLRLEELASIELEKVHMEEMILVVMGKGGKERAAPFDPETRRAIARYLSVRQGHALAWSPRLWLASKNRPALTPNGIRQMIRRRARELGIKIHPHMLRHTWADALKEAGVSDEDLSNLAGWTSPQMPRHYAKIAAKRRAVQTGRRLQGQIYQQRRGG